MPINSSRLPNLLIIGAPRCGTTSLHDWLVAHPRICGSARKETFYLMDRASHEFVERNNVHDHGLEGYSRLFDRCSGASVRLESTTGYLYQKTALDVLPGLPSEPRFVVVLREPAARVLSTFRYFRGHKAQLPPDFTFRRFIEAIDSGSPLVRDNEFLGAAIEHSRYAAHLARWRDCVEPERFRVVLFEDLLRNARTLVPELAAWCGVDAEFYASYAWPHRNESYEVRFPRVHAGIRSFILPLVRGERVRRALRGLYISLNGSRARVADDDEAAVLATLRERFAEDNDRLAREWRLDLSPWGTPRTQTSFRG